MSPRESLTGIDKHLYSYAQISIVFTPYQGNFSLQQMKSIKENDSQLKRQSCGAQSDTPIKYSSHDAQGTLRRGEKKWNSQRIREIVS